MRSDDSSGQVELNQPASALVDSATASLPTRRKLIKLGSSAVPVIATLTSQPVLAWHCNTASAWGSAKVGTTASQTARNKSNEQVNETWTILNWKTRANQTNSTRAGLGQPWVVLTSKYSGLAGLHNRKTSNVIDPNLLQINELYANVTALQDITGLSRTSTATVAATLQANSTHFISHLLVAQLNYLLLSNVSGSSWNVCLKSPSESASVIPGTLKKMSLGTYHYPTNTPWSQSMIVEYLEKNYIAVGS